MYAREPLQCNRKLESRKKEKERETKIEIQKIQTERKK